MQLFLFTWLLALSIQVAGTDAVRIVIRAPVTTFGHTVKSVEKVMRRDPRTSTLEPVPNSQSPIPNGLLVLDYAGVVITLRIATYTGGSGLAAVEITDAAWLARLGVPPTRRAVEARLGPPTRATQGAVVYEDSAGSDIGPQVLRLSFDGDRLVRAQWSWPFD